MIFRSRFARYSPASAATLFILSACSFEPVPSNPVSEGAGALTSSAPAPDVGTNSDRVATNPGVAAAGDRAVTSGNGAAPAGDGATTPDDALATVSDAVDPALASAVFFCSLVSFCDHGAYTHRSRVGSTSALHAYEPSISAAVALGVHVRCVI